MDLGPSLRLTAWVLCDRNGGTLTWNNVASQTASTGSFTWTNAPIVARYAPVSSMMQCTTTVTSAY
jgi:hypothetical protein